MRRAAAVVLGTVAGTALLVGTKIGGAGTKATADDSAGPVVVAGGPGVTASGPSGRSTRPAGKGRSSAGGPPTTPAPGRTGGTPTPTRSTKPTATPHPTPTPTPTPSGPADGRYSASAPVDGGRYGTLSMTVTISGHRISAISASESDDTNCYRNSCPKLTSEALAAQNANINSVSGATYSSSAYKSTLQAILNRANG